MDDGAIGEDECAANALHPDIPQNVQFGLRIGGADSDVSEVFEDSGITDGVVVQELRDVAG
jgi:hypothetical protein